MDIRISPTLNCLGGVVCECQLKLGFGCAWIQPSATTWRSLTLNTNLEFRLRNTKDAAREHALVRVDGWLDCQPTHYPLGDPKTTEGHTWNFRWTLERRRCVVWALTIIPSKTQDPLGKYRASKLDPCPSKSAIAPFFDTAWLLNRPSIGTTTDGYVCPKGTEKGCWRPNDIGRFSARAKIRGETWL